MKKYHHNLQLGERVQRHKGFRVNKLDVIPAQVSARQGQAGKRGAEQESEAADTGLGKGFDTNECGICSPLVGSEFCLIAAPWRQMFESVSGQFLTE